MKALATILLALVLCGCENGIPPFSQLRSPKDFNKEDVQWVSNYLGVDEGDSFTKVIIKLAEKVKDLENQ